MKLARMALFVVLASAIGLVGSRYIHGNDTDMRGGPDRSAAPYRGTPNPDRVISSTVQSRRYRLDASQSRFVARAFSGGLLWFKGHDHLIAVRDFTGEAQLTPGSITPASLEIIAKAASMVETRDVFTEPQKEIINRELREIVLEPAKYPDILFHSAEVTGEQNANGEYELTIKGNLNLHGITRPIVIPTTVSLSGNDLRARGEFSIERSDFGVKATSAFHGMVRVRNNIKFEFDIVGHAQ